MADFTAAEVEELEKMGNKKARKIWKAKLDDNIKIEIDNIEQIKTIMAATYKDKKYYKDPNEKKKKKTADKDKKKEKDDESDSDSDSDDEADKKKKKKNKIKKKVAIADSAGAAKDNTTGFTSDPFANNAPSSEKKDTGIDFLSNLDFVEAPIPDRRNSNGGGGRLSFSSAFGGQSSSNSVFDNNNNNHKGGGSVFPDHSSSSHNGNGAIVSLRSADDPAVQFLLNQLKIAAKQFDLLPADLKAVVHTTLQVYEKSLQQAAKEGKDITKVNNDVDHFLDLDAQVQDAANSSGNPFDDDFDDADNAATTANPFGGAGVGVGSPTNIFGGGPMPSIPAPSAASPINPYAAQMNAAALYNQQQQQQQLSQQMQQQLIIQQRMQQQMVQQQQAVAAAMMAGQQFYPQSVGAATMQPFPNVVAAPTPQQNLFNVPAAQPQPTPATQPAKHDIFAALNPFP